MRAALLGVLLVGCAAPSPDPDPDPSPAPICQGSMAAGDVRVVAADFTGGTEGIAFSPDGRLFVGREDTIDELLPDGTHVHVADVPDVVGLAWWGDRLAAAGDSALGDDLGGVWLIDVDAGESALLTSGIDSANFPAVTPWGSLLVSDADAAIVEVTSDGDVSPWASVLSPNGVAFSADGAWAFVASTFANPAPLWRLPVQDGVAGAAEELVSWGPGVVPDGIAMGASGAVYVAQNIAGRVDRVQPGDADDASFETVGDGVAWAASLAFGVGADWDPCAVYVTSLFGPEIYAMGVGEASGRIW